MSGLASYLPRSSEPTLENCSNQPRIVAFEPQP
jgi:hypothetical protein